MSFSKSVRMAALGLFVLGILAPSFARAQSQATDGAIEGTITDSTGAVLPGVTVEAASPALIERVRSVVPCEPPSCGGACLIRRQSFFRRR